MVCYIIACHWLKKNYGEKKPNKKEEKGEEENTLSNRNSPDQISSCLELIFFHRPSDVCSLDPSDGFTVSASVLNQPLCDGVVIKLLAAQSTEQVCIASLNFYFINLNKKFLSLCWS